MIAPYKQYDVVMAWQGNHWWPGVITTDRESEVWMQHVNKEWKFHILFLAKNCESEWVSVNRLRYFKNNYRVFDKRNPGHKKKKMKKALRKANFFLNSWENLRKYKNLGPASENTLGFNKDNSPGPMSTFRGFSKTTTVSSQAAFTSQNEKEQPVKLPELTEEMKTLIRRAVMSQGEVLVDAHKIQITVKDVTKLTNLNWLNDEIINFYMQVNIEG